MPFDWIQLAFDLMWVAAISTIAILAYILYCNRGPVEHAQEQQQLQNIYNEPPKKKRGRPKKKAA